jgi:hypothetical protein
MKRILLFAVAMLAVFGVVVGILLQVMPGPLKNSDYFLIGSMATVASLALLFVLILATSKNTGGVFFKKRKKG